MLMNLSLGGCGRKLSSLVGVSPVVGWGLACGPFWGTGPNSGTLFQLVTCPSGRRCNTRNVVWCKSQRGFKSHRHRHVRRPCFPLFMREAGPFALPGGMPTVGCELRAAPLRQLQQERIDRLEPQQSDGLREDGDAENQAYSCRCGGRRTS